MSGRLLFVLASSLLALVSCYERLYQPAEGEFPYPYSPASRINLGQFTGKLATVTLFSVTGESMGVIFDGMVDPAASVELDTARIVSIDSTGRADTAITLIDTLKEGVYFYRVVTADTTITRKMVLLK